MKKQTILVVDDELRVARLIQANLEAWGYAVSTAYDGSEAVRKAAVENPDLIILDIILPGEFDGYDVCRRIRSFSGVPIIMLTAKALEKDKVSVVFIAQDAEEHVTAGLKELCRNKNVEMVMVNSMKELGEACGIQVGAASAAILNQ